MATNLMFPSAPGQYYDIAQGWYTLPLHWIAQEGGMLFLWTTDFTLIKAFDLKLAYWH